MYDHYYEYPHGSHLVKKHYGIRSERYKLIHFYDDIDAWEFYDLQRDPDEVQNLIDDPAYSKRIKQHRQQLYALQKKYQDTSAP